MTKQKRYVEATGSVTVETVTARLVGMETNASSSATSPPGKASEDAQLQMAESAATEGLVCVVNVLATMSIRPGTGGTFTGTPASVTRGTAELSMTGIPMTSAQVMDSVIVEDVTAKQAGMGRSVSTHDPACCPLRRASGSVREALSCPAPEGANVNVANALATRQGTAGCTARLASVTIAAVRTSRVWSVEAMALVPVVTVSAREDGSAHSANIRGNAT